MKEKYIQLLELFLANDIDAKKFESSFLKMFKDETSMPDTLYNILDPFFSDVDMFCPDESIRDDDDLDEEELRDSAQKTLSLLKKI